MPEIKPLSPEIKKRVLQMQQNELTEYHIYTKVAGFVKNPENKATLLKIANEEHRHYQIWETFTKEKVQPIQWKVWWYTYCRRDTAGTEDSRGRRAARAEAAGDLG